MLNSSIKFRGFSLSYDLDVFYLYLIAAEVNNARCLNQKSLMLVVWIWPCALSNQTDKLKWCLSIRYVVVFIRHTYVSFLKVLRERLTWRSAFLWTYLFNSGKNMCSVFFDSRYNCFHVWSSRNQFCFFAKFKFSVQSQALHCSLHWSEVLWIMIDQKLPNLSS